MFTGLVEEMGIVKNLRYVDGSIVFTIHAKSTLHDLKVDHSIAVDGVCLTVIKRTKTTFDVQAVEETLKKTTLGNLVVGSAVNLERSLLPQSRLGGHFVLGHVDGIGRVTRIEPRESSWMFWFRVPPKFAKYLIPVGSVAVNGVSLTVAELKGNEFGVSIIPHTMEVTTFRFLKPNDTVNIEFDMIGKYVERLLVAYHKSRKNQVYR
ncbi:MAG: riboflavin synthase [Bacteroidetes bacterium]|nr:riboflavin synthase [Bacteroidota bacterium]